MIILTIFILIYKHIDRYVDRYYIFIIKKNRLLRILKQKRSIKIKIKELDN